MTEQRIALPVDAVLPEITAQLARQPNLVVTAPPGSGKTTRVPAALLDAEFARGGEVWVLEPRRLATRLAARRVAEERGEAVGATVGYQVRFEDVSSVQTRLRFLTEGVLTRRMMRDPQLQNVKAVVLDEFHERHLQTDLALATLRNLQRTTRPDLRLVVMSATLAAAPLAEYLGACPQARAAGQIYDVAVEHLLRDDARPLEQKVVGALKQVAARETAGDVLVFLPGAGEIRRTRETCAALAAQNDWLILPLHGELPVEEQDRAVRSCKQRKIILATNVAESSVTIPGVGIVIDTGLARVASFAAWSGARVLSTEKISQASAVQRTGRAGRTQHGVCLRLYTAQDFNARAPYETPEIARLDLTEMLLQARALGARAINSWVWFESPPPVRVAAAEELLRWLGALTDEGHLTETGAAILQLPLAPRAARVAVAAARHGLIDDGALLGAILGERDMRRADPLQTNPGGARRGHIGVDISDALYLRDLFRAAADANFAADKMQRLGLDSNGAHAVARATQQIKRALKSVAVKSPAGAQASGDLSAEEKLLLSLLTGFPDRVARRRAFGETKKNAGGSADEFVLASGGALRLATESVVRGAELIVVLDATDNRALEQKQGRSGGRGGASLTARMVSAIEPEWLLDLYPERLRETVETEWNARAERVEARSRLLYDHLVLDETVTTNPAAHAEVAEALLQAARTAGVGKFVDEDELQRFIERANFVARHAPELGGVVLTEHDVDDALRELCAGKSSFAELRAAAKTGALHELLRSRLSREQARALNEFAPERITLKSGRNARVNYEADKPPWIASRLQDFFGMTETPRIAGGRVALVAHLLAPNQRAVQVTEDLSGFWQRHYPSIRRELMRRYPKHNWQENPLMPPPRDAKNEKR